jgi:hypothetical protein
MYSATAIVGSPGLVPSGPKGDVPGRFSLEQNFPYPFNPSTKTECSLSETGWVTLTVHDMLGQELATIVSGERAAGGQPSGVYSYRLTAGGHIQTKKMNSLR